MITLNYCISGSSIGDLSPKLSYHVAAGSVAMEWSGKGTGPKKDWAFLGVLEDFNCIIRALSDIQAEKASVSSDYDKKLIFQMIEQSSGGFELVNQTVKSELRCWYIERLKDLIEQYLVDFKLLLQCAKIIYLLGFCKKTFSHYKSAYN